MVFQIRAFVRFALYFLIQSKISAQPNASVFHRRSLNYPFQSVNSFCTCFQNLFHHSPRTHRTINNRQIDAPLCTSNLKGKIHRVGFFLVRNRRCAVLFQGRVEYSVDTRSNLSASVNTEIRVVWKKGMIENDGEATMSHVSGDTCRVHVTGKRSSNIIWKTRKQLGHVFTRVRIDEPIFSFRECVLLEKYHRRRWV